MKPTWEMALTTVFVKIAATKELHKGVPFHLARRVGFPMTAPLLWTVARASVPEALDMRTNVRNLWTKHVLSRSARPVDFPIPVTPLAGLVAWVLVRPEAWDEWRNAKKSSTGHAFPH